VLAWRGSEKPVSTLLRTSKMSRRETWAGLDGFVREAHRLHSQKPFERSLASWKTPSSMPLSTATFPFRCGQIQD
jgi:hypothetical protein